MKTEKQTIKTNQPKAVKIFKPLEIKHLESIVGGPITSRGTETTVQDGN
jgi:hypothetical protein